MKRRYIVYTLPFQKNIGGNIVLHKLCDMLNKHGYEAYLWPYKDNFHDFKVNEYYQTPVANPEHLKDSIIIYPEIVEGNPLKGDHVVRWLLNTPGVMGGDGIFNKNDMVFYFSNIFADPKRTKANYLEIVELFGNIFHNNEQRRSGSCYVRRKGRNREIVHDTTNSIEIIDTTPSDSLADIFNRAKYFYSYDDATLLSAQAAMSGCISIVIPKAGVDPKMWHRMCPSRKYGIAYGLEEIDFAASTMNLVAGTLIAFENISHLMVEDFIQRTQICAEHRITMEEYDNSFMSFDALIRQATIQTYYNNLLYARSLLNRARELEMDSLELRRAESALEDARLEISNSLRCDNPEDAGIYGDMYDVLVLETLKLGDTEIQDWVLKKYLGSELSRPVDKLNLLYHCLTGKEISTHGNHAVTWLRLENLEKSEDYRLFEAERYIEAGQLVEAGGFLKGLISSSQANIDVLNDTARLLNKALGVEFKDKLAGGSGSITNRGQTLSAASDIKDSPHINLHLHTQDNNSEYQRTAGEIVMMEDFPLCATLSESDTRQAFASLGAWYTGFKFNGRLYGGNNTYTNDPRLEDFLTWYKEGGNILELGSFEASHTLRLAQSPQVRSVLGLEGRDYLITRSKLIKLLSGSDKMNFAQCDLEKDEISSFGRFDVVFCSGLLYLLSKPWELIKKITAISDNLYLSTHIANSSVTSVLGHDGEFHQGGAYQDPLGALTAQPFWLTFESLVKTLAENGFKIVNVRHFSDWGGYKLVDLFCSKRTPSSALPRREQPAPEVQEEEHITEVGKEVQRDIEYSTRGPAMDEDYLRLVEEIVMRENFSLDTSLSESQISDSFKELGPWRTKFTFNGKHYGGENSYVGDPRVRDFFTWFRKGGAVLEIGSFEGSHTLRLVQSPRIESVFGLEGRDYLVRRSKFIKSVSGSDKMNFVQCDFETEDISSYGRFDAVFCSGLLYHLSKPWELIEKIATITDNLFLSTHYAKTGSISLHDLEGEYYHEGPFEDPLSGLTPQSFWLTYDSLTRVLENNGLRVINARHFDNWGGHKLANIFCSKEKA